LKGTGPTAVDLPIEDGGGEEEGREDVLEEAIRVGAILDIL
jgi:hypothetical protein